MSTSVEMPALGESVSEGTVTRWLKSVGDSVEVDEPLLEVSTDKVDTEIPSPVAGTLQKILVDEDETVAVGAALCEIGDGPAEDADSGADEPAEEEPEPEPQKDAPKQTEAEKDEPAEKKASGGSSSGGGGTEVTMPALGESVTEGTVTRWLKSVGDSVEVDEPLLEVSTDKVDTEIPSPVAGTLQKILVDEDDTAQVGAPLAVIGDGAPAADEPAEQEPPEEKPEPEPEDTEPDAEADTEPEAAAEPAAPVTSESSDKPGSDEAGSGYVTPLVRKLAAQHGVDLSNVKGTGIGGRIRKQDVLDAAGVGKAEEPAPAPAPAAPAAAPAPAPEAKAPATAPAARPAPSSQRGTTEKLSRLRKVIAARMMESLHGSAQLTTVVEVDMTKVMALRARAKDNFKAREGVGLSPMPFIALAAIEGLKAHPKVNSQLDGDNLVFPDNEHLAIAVETERGLLTPVIHNAGDLNLAALARKIADLAGRTRTNKVTPDELSGGTFTLTNTGSRGALFDTPIINMPQMAILGCGAVVKRPMVISDADGNDVIGIRSMMYLALSYDHRIVDGADAAKYLGDVKARLEEGAFESEVGL